MIVVIEGIDGSGKTTQSRLLGNSCSSLFKSVVVLPHPKGTEIGMLLYSAMKEAPNNETEVAIACAMHFSLLPILEEYKGSRDKLLILDRYWPSTIVYQKPVGQIENVFSLCLDMLPKPDLMVFLSPPASVAEERIAKRGSEAGEGKFECCLPVKSAAYEKLASRANAAVISDQDLEAVSSQLFQLVVQLLGRA